MTREEAAQKVLDLVLELEAQGFTISGHWDDEITVVVDGLAIVNRSGTGWEIEP